MAAPMKMGFSFGFAKKAEPKRVVEALKVEKPEDLVKKVAIENVEDGHIKVDAKVEEAKLPTIVCKNLLEASIRSQAAASSDAAPAATASSDAAPAAPAKPKTSPDDLPGGLLPPKPKVVKESSPSELLQNNISKLSEEDREAMAELLKDAGQEGDAAALAPKADKIVPILMRPGSRQIRQTSGADASSDMFDAMPVESFGAALLRGMGYDPETHKTNAIYHDKPRDNLLGLGATALLPHERAKITNANRKVGKSLAPALEKPVVAGAAASSGSTAAASSSPPAAGGEKRKSPSPSPDVVVDDDTPPEKRRRAESPAVATQEDLWMVRGLVARVVNSRGKLKDFYGVDAVVVKVDEVAMVCTIKARPASDPDGKSRVIEDVKPSDLETRVNRTCEKVRIVRGPHKGTNVRLLKRNSGGGNCKVKLNGEEVEMLLADVCEFMA